GRDPEVVRWRIVGASRSGKPSPAPPGLRNGGEPTQGSVYDEPFVSRRNKMTRRLADQPRAPSRECAGLRRAHLLGLRTRTSGSAQASRVKSAIANILATVVSPYRNCK